MKINQVKRSNAHKSKAAIITVVIVVFLAIASVLFYRQYNSPDSSSKPRDVNSVDYTERTSEDQEQANAKKQELIEKSKSQSTNQTSETISVSINRFSQIPNEQVQLRSIVTGAESSNCEARFSLGNSGFTKEFAAINTGTYWACNLDLNLEDFPGSGSWKVSLTATSTEGIKSAPATSTAEINK